MMFPTDVLKDENFFSYITRLYKLGYTYKQIIEGWKNHYLFRHYCLSNPKESNNTNKRCPYRFYSAELE